MLFAFSLGQLWGIVLAMLVQRHAVQLAKDQIARAEKIAAPNPPTLHVGENAPTLEPFYPTPEKYAAHVERQKNKGPWSKEA